MGKKFLIDTNIIIYHFKDEIPDHATAWIDKIFTSSFNISIITKIEFLGWKDYTPEQYDQASHFVSNANVLSLRQKIVNKTIQLRRQKRIKLADAIIAATCLVKNLYSYYSKYRGFPRYRGFKYNQSFSRYFGLN